MTAQKPKLELTWIGKDKRPRLEPRILIEDSSKSYHAATKLEGDNFNNMVVHGDNLLALKALESDERFKGKVKCVFIDPPYNTGSAFEHYDDSIEHSLWLSLMRDRLEIIKNLLSEEGSLWITIDDNEAHYLKILCDEVLGRSNFVANIVWQKRTSPEARLALGSAHDNVLVYAKEIERVQLNKLQRSLDQERNFKNPDNDQRGPWASSDFTAQGWRPNQMYKITSPAGEIFEPPPGRCWGNIEEEFAKLLADNRMWFGKDGTSRPRVKTFLSEQEGVSSWTWWPNSEVGHNQEAKKESISLFGAINAFATPKPERLLKRILEIATIRGDLVLDSFGGSGTTGAVAQKMGRRWILVELGEHANTHILPRLRKVVDGEDDGGVTEAVGWRGGGGFRFYNLAPSLLERDKWGRWVISKDYNAGMLAEAMCKHMGFSYAPSQDKAEYWKHGNSSEHDFIFVTTLSLTHEHLRAISEDVGSDRTLLICCRAFNARVEDFENLTLTKIPHAILSRCEWGKDDYSLNIASLPEREPDPEPTADTRSKAKTAKPVMPSLFDDEEV